MRIERKLDEFGREDVEIWHDESDSCLFGYWGPVNAIKSDFEEDHVDGVALDVDMMAVISKVDANPSCRQQGMGTVLVCKFLALCRKQEIEKVCLYAAASDVGDFDGNAQQAWFDNPRWYRRFGFHELSDADEPVMELHLHETEQEHQRWQGLLVRTLRRRFGTMVDARVDQRIKAASREEIEAWFDRVLSAGTLSEVITE